MKEFKLYIETKENEIEKTLARLDAELNEYRKTIIKNKFNKRMKDKTRNKYIADESWLVRGSIVSLNIHLLQLSGKTKTVKEKYGSDNYYVAYAEEYIRQVVCKRNMYKNIFETYKPLIDEAENYLKNKN